MNDRLLFDYIKCFVGIGIVILAYIVQPKFWEVLGLIGSLIILSSGVTFQFGRNERP